MSASLQRLLPLFERERACGNAMVLATVVRTAGPTYTKPGSLMLIAASGEYAGLLSGGCLEGDLSAHSRSVLDGGSAKLVRYDMRGPDDLLFGLGSGCEGAMDIQLQRLDAAQSWQPMDRLAQAWRAQRAEKLLLVVQSTDPDLPPGSGVFATDGQTFGAKGTSAQLNSLRAAAAAWSFGSASRYVPELLSDLDVLALQQPPPARVLLLGAGPDALPVVELAVFLGWQISVIDHRNHYAQSERFPGAIAVLNGGPATAIQLLQPQQGSTPFSAAIVMSHHLANDLAYLRALAKSDVPYVGLLGPALRRDRLLADLRDDADSLRSRLRGPVGLDLGAVTPESIALSIVAEIHAALAHGASMQPLSAKIP